MRKLTKILTIAALSAAVTGMPAAHAGEDLNPHAFVTMCDADNDGMVSKAEVMKMVEKMFDKHDEKRMGKLDQKQVEFFLQELMRSGG